MRSLSYVIALAFFDGAIARLLDRPRYAMALARSAIAAPRW